MNYLLKLFKFNMQNTLKPSFRPRFNSNGTYNYEAAIDALNSLQSNAQYLRNRRAETEENNTHVALRQNCIGKMEAFLNRSNIEISKLKSVIHVAGTKGKGSTCAFCESILRQHGFKTGFYSSPHLTNVTERIRINGQTIDNQKFAQTFWDIYLALLQSKQNDFQMPIYFQMLTLVAFKVFLQENVDVAIVEVGIGGEYDSTNVISQSDVVGITSLGLDHTSILGNTIEKIAWHKGGIMKKDCKAYTVSQSVEALKVLIKRSADIGCDLEIVSPNKFLPQQIIMPNEVFESNASLAMRMAEAWLSLNNQKMSQDKAHKALIDCHWPGRFQIIHTQFINFYLDGAHTAESLNFCAEWFTSKQKCSSFSHLKHVQKCLIFNSTGDRNVGIHLQILHKCGFDKVFFVPNVCKTANVLGNYTDNISHNFPESDQLIRCSLNNSKWCELFPNDAGKACVLPSINAAYEHIIDAGGYHEVLITGSLHLVGGAIQALNTMNNNIINAVRNN